MMSPDTWGRSQSAWLAAIVSVVLAALTAFALLPIMKERIEKQFDDSSE